MSAKNVLPSLVLLGALLVSQSVVAQTKASLGLFNSIKNKNLKQAEKLIAADASIVNNQIQGQLPLFWTAQYKANDIAKLLLENGADVNAKSPNGTPVLFEILRRRLSEDVVMAILDKSPDLTTVSSRGQNVLSLALSRGASVKTIERLLELGADPTQKNSRGQTAIIVAMQSQRGDVFDALFKSADLNLVDAQGDTLLMRACRFRNVDIASKLIDRMVAEKINIDARNNKQQTALHLASRFGMRVVIQKLLDAGASVELMDDSKNTPLVSAVYSGSQAAIELLTRHGAKVKQLYDVEPAAFSNIIRSNNAKTMRLLFDRGFQPKKLDGAKQFSILAIAIDMHQSLGATQKLAMLKQLCDNGFDQNVVGGSGPDQGKLPIDRAVARGFVPIAEFLVEGTDLGKSKSKPEFLFEWACDNNAKKMAAKLLDLKPKLVNAKLNGGRSALLIAAEAGNTELVKKLVSNGANVNAYFSDGNSPLLLAAGAGHLETVSVLLKAGADANAADETGQSALHLACWSSSEDVVSALIAAGANVNATTNTKKTPLHVAAWNGASDCVAAILATGDVNIEARDSDGWTPLHKAAFRGNDLAVDKLVQKGADKTITTTAGMTALELAQDKKRKRIVGLLK